VICPAPIWKSLSGLLKCRLGHPECFTPTRARKAYYVIDGATASLPDGKQINLEPGTAKINVRDVPHGAFKVIGDKALKLLTVHIVDKGKPMTVPVK
jgi:hypothetical protein